MLDNWENMQDKKRGGYDQDILYACMKLLKIKNCLIVRNPGKEVCAPVTLELIHWMDKWIPKIH